MLSGQYDILVNNMWLTDIIAIILLILPLFLIFMDKKWIFTFYAISIVSNLPLIFALTFNFSYEAILSIVLIIILIKDIYRDRTLRYITTKQNLVLMLMLIIVLGVNIFTAFFHLNLNAVIVRLIIYAVNIFILLVYTYFFKDYKSIKYVINGMIIGGLILVISMIAEMIYGHYYVGIRNMRPAGLLLDPNVCAFALNLVFVLSFFERKKHVFWHDLYYLFARVILLFGVFLTVSRSAYIGTLFVLILLVIYYSKGKKRWIVPSVVIVFIVMYLIFHRVIIDFINNIYNIIDLGRIIPKNINTPPSSNGPGGGGGGIVDGGDYSNSRLALISAAFIVFSNNFITGVGIGNVVGEINFITGLEMNAHNLYLQLLAESGIIMFITLLIFAYYLFVFISKLEKKHKFLILLIFGLVFIETLFNHNLLNINIIYLVLAIILGLNMISAKDRRVYVFSRENFKIRKKSFK